MSERPWRNAAVRLACLAVLVSSATCLTAQEKPAPEATKASGLSQPAPRDYRFEVASIRPGEPSGQWTGALGRSSPKRFTAESATIVTLAMRAFRLKNMFQIEFAPWMISTRFNVIATIPEGAANTDLPVMIQHLLEDRFGLVYHRETRRMPGYRLVVAKSGAKFAKSAEPRPIDEGGPRNNIEMKNGAPQFRKDAGSGHLIDIRTMTAVWRGRNKTMDDLAVDLAGTLREPVTNATGLEGEYDYTLTFTPEAHGAPGNQAVPMSPNSTEAPAQSEFLTNPLLRDALRIQLGLELQPLKDVSVEVVVIDSARKKPTEN
jgi:uncharacterized protein (TIGR03435 family)